MRDAYQSAQLYPQVVTGFSKQALKDGLLKCVLSDEHAGEIDKREKKEAHTTQIGKIQLVGCDVVVKKSQR